MQTRRVPLPFIGPTAASSSDFGRIRFHLMRLIQRADSPGGIHGVRHYWLCERCSHVFTLAYDEECGVTLKLIWSELAAGETHKELSAA